jgi:sarcosine oxidase subunit gamma
MAEPYLLQHALAHRGLDARPAAPADRAVCLSIVPAAAQLCLRGDGSRAFCAAVESVLGVAPPGQANTAASGGDGTRVLWLGPDEWLAVRDGGDGVALAAALDEALSAEHALVTDVSHSRVVVALEGPRAREVLMKGCSLDLDPVAFRPGRCAQTALARAHMLLHQVSDAPGYHVYAHRSFADYVYAWLADAAAEYQGPVGG